MPDDSIHQLQKTGTVLTLMPYKTEKPILTLPGGWVSIKKVIAKAIQMLIGNNFVKVPEIILTY